MKTILTYLFFASSIFTFGQHYFDGSVTFKLYDEGRQILYDEFMSDWKIIDDRNCVRMFMDDTVSRNGDYFELIRDKRNFMKYIDSTGAFSIHAGGGSPYFSFALARNEDTLCYFSFGASDFHTDSIPTNRKTHSYSRYDRNENTPGEPIVLKMESEINELEFYREEGDVEETED